MSGVIDIFKLFIKQQKPRCYHDWEQLERLSVQLDYSGFEKALYRCKCKKCGTIEVRSYW